MLALSLASVSCSSQNGRVQPLPVESCDSLVGTEPWLILMTEIYPGLMCVRVGIHQNVQIWNKGFEPMTVEWFESTLRIASGQKNPPSIPILASREAASGSPGTRPPEIELGVDRWNA